VTILIPPAVIDSRCVKLHRSRSERHFARLGMTVAHHQGVLMLVTLAVMALNVIVDLGPERFAQYPPYALARDLIQQQKLLTCLPLIPTSRLPSASVASPSTRLPPGFAFALRGRVRRLFHACIRSITFSIARARYCVRVIRMKA
jgi:hypothetical protein